MIFCSPGRLRFLFGMLFPLGFYGIPAWSQARNYYISAAGSNRNCGCSPDHAWHSPAILNTLRLQPGDSVLLRGGDTVRGPIILSRGEDGIPGYPIVFGSFGNGRACVSGRDGDRDSGGLIGVDSRYIHICRLDFLGPGPDRDSASGRGSGILFISRDPGRVPGHILLELCRSSGFGGYGILFRVAPEADIPGFRHIRIRNCQADSNGEAGIASEGGPWGYPNRDFRIRGCLAFDNPGIRGKKDNHSGDGIVLGGVDTLRIEDCEAYGNGAWNSCPGAGPVGIWVWMCRHALIEHCISHDNLTGTGKDGGGFDIDGGSSDCIIQYNISYRNEGAGFLLAEYGALFPFRDNTIRFNISLDDGRDHGYGGISLWGVDSLHPVRSSYLYNNTIVQDSGARDYSIPCDLFILGNHLDSVVLANNLLVSGVGTRFITSLNPLPRSSLLLENNDYASLGSGGFLWSGDLFAELRSWLQRAGGQERYQGRLRALALIPRFRQTRPAGSSSSQGEPGPGLGIPEPGLLLAHAGIDLDLLGIRNPGSSDFAGRPLRRPLPLGAFQKAWRSGELDRIWRSIP